MAHDAKGAEKFGLNATSYRVLSAIVSCARASVDTADEASDVPLNLLQILRAYEEVLPQHGLSAAADTFY